MKKYLIILLSSLLFGCSNSDSEPIVEVISEKDKLAFRKAGGVARLQSLIKDFRKYFTVEAGAFGIALCLCLVYAYFTAGVLRRPNASIYMSVLLAVVYYLTQMRSEQPDALPDGEEKRA